jgi:hypothetical protein
MPPTDVKDLYQWAVKNNKPYHKIFATWANREGYKSVAPALQRAGNLDTEALDYWTPDVWKIYWAEVRGIDWEMPPEWAKKRVPDELRDYLDTVFDAYDRIVFDWPTEYRQIGGQGNYAEGYTDDDIETTKQFRNAIAGLKARSAIDKAKDGAGAKYYADGAKVTPQETARRAAERKAKKDKKGMAEDIGDLGYNVVRYYEKTQEVKKLTNWLEKEAGLSRNSPLYFDDVDLVYGNKTIVPGALINPKLTFNDLLTAVVQASKQGMAEGGYQHGFADPNAPSLGGSRRKDDEGNSEFDDRQRRQTGMIFYKVDDTELAQQLGLKQTRTGKWYLRTGNRHAQQTADRAFGLGRIWYPESVEEAGVFGFMSNEPEKPVVKKPKFTLSQIRDMSKQQDEKTARYVRSNDLPKNPNHMRVVHDDVELGELSNKLLGKYKRELGVRASAADRAGDFDKGHEYFKKINRATIRQGENDARRHAEKEKENDVMETRLNMMRKAGYDL